MHQTPNTIDLLLVVAVLSTLLSVLFFAFMSWTCFKCFIQPYWRSRSHHWKSRLSSQKIFPPPHRDFVEMNRIPNGGQQRQAATQLPILHDQGFINDNSGKQ